MIRLSKRLLYSIEAVLDIACNEGPAPVRSVDITQREGIPARYLEPVLQELVREGLLMGIRGPAGGYRLARPAEEISIGDIVRIVQRTETGDDPMADSAESVLGLEVVRPLWTELRDEVMRRLEATSISQLRRKGLRVLRAVSPQPQPTAYPQHTRFKNDRVGNPHRRPTAVEKAKARQALRSLTETSRCT